MSFDSSSFPALDSTPSATASETLKTQFGATKRISQAERKKQAAELKAQRLTLERAKRQLESDPTNATAQENLSRAQEFLDKTSSRDLLGCITVGADPRLHGKEHPVTLPKPLPDPMADLKNGVFPAPRDETEEESALALHRVQAGTSLCRSRRAPAPARVRHRVCPEAKQGQQCPRGAECDGAHSLAEYRPPACRHGARCRFVTCSKGVYSNAVEKPCGFLHPSEDLTAYYERSGRCPPVFKKRKGSRKPQVEV